MIEKTILVVPCYNEEKRLKPELFMESLGKNHLLHWLFVDDGSVDKTAEIIRKMAKEKPSRIFSHFIPNNKGKGEAVRQGLLKAIEKKATLTGYFDADLATPMTEVLRLLNLFQKKNYKVLLGSRVFLLGHHIERKHWRFWLSRCFALVASGLLKLKVYDTQCGAKLISNFDNLKLCLEKPFVSRWLFDVELIGRILKTGKLQVSDFFEEPLLKWTDVGGSTLKLKSFFVAFMDLIKIKINKITKT